MRVRIVLTRTIKGTFEEKEIDALISKLPNEEIDFLLFNNDKTISLGFEVNKQHRIGTCAPFDICGKMDLH